MKMKKIKKAREYNSPKLSELLAEITPLEMEKTKVKMQISARIEELMEQKGWNKSELAEKVGKHPSEITKWMSGTQNFTMEVLTEIAFTLGVDVSVFFDNFCCLRTGGKHYCRGKWIKLLHHLVW